MDVFSADGLRALHQPNWATGSENAGQVTIIGGSRLFHGAPILSLKVASRISGMVFFASPEESIGRIAEQIKTKLLSFIWVPWEDRQAYIEKSHACLIGPGFMRFGSERTPEHERHHENHEAGKYTSEITQDLLQKYSDKKWVVDAGSLQVMEPEWIPANAVLTPNKKEYQYLFPDLDPGEASKKYNCIINVKGKPNVVYGNDKALEIPGGNPGLEKGGVGDVLAGLTVALLAKNEPFLSACAASYVTKAASDKLYGERSAYYNADDLAEKIPEVLAELIEQAR